MYHVLRILLALIALGLDVAGVAYLFMWMRKTDLMFGHYTGNPHYIFTATYLTGAGLALTLVWFLLGLARRLMLRTRTPTTRMRWAVTLGLGILLGVAALPTGFALVVGVTEWPRAEGALGHGHWRR